MQRVREQMGLYYGRFPQDGTGIGIAVLDTGVVVHPDLEGRILAFRDFVNHRSFPYDDSGHGTHVCGILSGSGRLSELRYMGMAPGAGLIVGKVLDGKGEGTTEHMLQGLDWVLQQKEKYNVRILNISVGIGNPDNQHKEKLLLEKLEKIWEEGIFVVCAAGNKGPDNNSIASVGGSAKILTVGCHDGAFFRNAPSRCELYSGRGDINSKIRKPDLVAPGTNIISCSVKCKITRNGYQNVYIPKSGTSMATPIVAGAAALLMQKYPDITNEICRLRMLFSCQDLGIPWNRQGWGMLNVARLLE